MCRQAFIACGRLDDGLASRLCLAACTADQGSGLPLMLQVLSLGPGVPSTTLDACLRVIAENLSLLSVESLALAAHTAVAVATNSGGDASVNTTASPGSHASMGMLVEDVAAAVLSLLRDGREGGSPVRIKSKVS